MLKDLKQEFIDSGYVILNQIYSDEEIEHILHLVAAAHISGATFRKTNDLFAIRQFFKAIPQVADVIFNQELRTIINSNFGSDYFITKSIYFDKPEKSNWFVAYHQDLTISVDKKCEIEGYGPWTTKQNQFAVQPPLNILQDNFTIRIHLDNTTKDNGALKVVPCSHNKGVYRSELIDWEIEKEKICEVKKGSIMLMSPLLLHSSSRTINNNRRRVIHIEFSKKSLPRELHWAEYLPIPKVSNSIS